MAALIISVVLSVLAGIAESCLATAVTTTPCRACAMNLIAITQVRGGAKPMESDVIDRTTATCAVRTFTCLGANSNIEVILVDGAGRHINGGDGTVADADDGVTDGTTTFVVTCNTAGTAWVNSGLAITQVECASN